MNKPPYDNNTSNYWTNLDPFRVTALKVPSNTVAINPGTTTIGNGVIITYAGGYSPLITAPAHGASPNYTLLCLDSSGVPVIFQSTSIPTVPKNHLGLALIYQTELNTAITNDLIQDIRPLVANATYSVLDGALTYKGTWNASTNSPTMPAAATGNNGFYYLVSVSGTTTVDGISSWTAGNWLISNGTTWEKVTSVGTVSSVNTRVGAITLAKGDVALGNVDNTADASKPISTAQQTALDLKADLVNPVFTTPNLGTPSAGILTSCTGTAAGLTAGHVTTNANLTGAITSTGNATVLGSFSSAALATALTDESGTGAVVFTNSATLVSPTFITPALGTPASGVLTNCTGTAAGLTAGAVTTNANLTGVITSTGNATVLGSFSSAALATALTDETGSGTVVFSTAPTITNATLVTPALGTPSSGVLTNCTGTAAGLTAGHVTTNANLTGEVTSSGNVATITNDSVIAKVLTGYTSGAGTIAATDSILSAIQKLNGNIALKAASISPTLTTPNLGTPSAGVLTNCTGTAAGLTAGTVTTNANLTGEVTSVGNATTVTNAAVIGKVLTGYVSGAGTVAATDTILAAIQKLNGNVALKAASNAVSGTFTTVNSKTVTVTNGIITSIV